MTAASQPAKGGGPVAGPVAGTIAWFFFGPGVLIGLVPYYLSGWQQQGAFLGLEWSRWCGAALFVLAAPVFIDFFIRFVREGRGTPTPIVPTRHLVVTGTYRHVRNPAYIAAVSLIVGQALYLGSTAILVYAAGVALVFHLYVVLHEEPSLRRRFGAEYAAYCRRVRRWLPRVRPDQDTDRV